MATVHFQNQRTGAHMLCGVEVLGQAMSGPANVTCRGCLERLADAGVVALIDSGRFVSVRMGPIRGEVRELERAARAFRVPDADTNPESYLNDNFDPNGADPFGGFSGR